MNGSTKFFCILLAVTALGGRAWSAEGEAVAAKEAAPAVKAPDAPRRDFGAERFKEMDTDKNGSISLDEFKVVQEKRIEGMKKRMGEKFDATKVPSAEEAFKKADADANGSLSMEELRKMGGDRRKGPGEGKRDGANKGVAAPTPEATK
jgi:hypothetical protein